VRRRSATGEASRPILIPRGVAAQIRRECAAGLPAETGGVLVGYEMDEGTHITLATGPGPHAKRTRSRFRRDGAYTQAEVDRAHDESGGREDYVGEWHSHPDPVGPSGIDCGSMEWVSKNSRYHRSSPVMILARRTRLRRWKLEGYRWRETRLLAVPIKSSASCRPFYTKRIVSMSS
jgi:integrative and conjugative element protein (TIGR02256 family)